MYVSDRRESPLFVKTEGFIVWLFQHTAKFPRQYRHTLTERLERSALDFQRCLAECLILRRVEALERADLELWQIRRLLRIANALNILPARLLEHTSEVTAELGRLLGAWRRKGTGT